MVSIIIGNIMMGISILINVITMQQKDGKNILIGLTFVNLTAIESIVKFTQTLRYSLLIYFPYFINLFFAWQQGHTFFWISDISGIRDWTYKFLSFKEEKLFKLFSLKLLILLLKQIIILLDVLDILD